MSVRWYRYKQIFRFRYGTRIPQFRELSVTAVVVAYMHVGSPFSRPPSAASGSDSLHSLVRPPRRPRRRWHLPGFDMMQNLVYLGSGGGSGRRAGGGGGSGGASNNERVGRDSWTGMGAARAGSRNPGPAGAPSEGKLNFEAAVGPDAPPFFGVPPSHGVL